MWKIAWRNLWRNRNRTLIAGSAIAFSYALFLVSMGIGDATHAKMEEAAVRTAGGNLLIHGDGYWESQAAEIVIDEPARVDEVVRRVEGVEQTVRRVIVNGLVSGPRGNQMVRFHGIEPDQEALLTDYAPYVVAGDWVDVGDKPLVLGDALVERLELELGDRVVLTASGPDGEITRALFRLSGVLDAGMEAIDEMAAFTTIPAAQEALRLGERLTQIGVLVEDDRQRYAVQERVRRALAEQELAGGLEVLTWDEAIPEMLGYIELDNAFLYLFAGLVFVVVGFGIANTFLMSVLERIREFGLLSALGLTPARVGRLLVYETALLAVVSLVAGLLLGLLLHAYLVAVGIDITQWVDMDFDIGGVAWTERVIRSEIRPSKWLTATAAVFALVFVSALYPAWRATRLDPAQAMRTYE